MAAGSSSERRRDGVGSPFSGINDLASALPTSVVPPLFTNLPPLCNFDPSNLSPVSRLSYRFSANLPGPSPRGSSVPETTDHDQLKSETVRAQNRTVAACLPFLSGTKDGLAPSFNQHGVPALQWQMHVEFLRDSVEMKPSGFVAFDPARPWIVYWATTALSLLRELAPKKPEENEWEYGVRLRDNKAIRNRALDTFHSQQNSTGGFGGSHGHYSHVAPSYAAVLALANLATIPDGRDTLSLIDRHGMWRWLCALKQPDGGIAVCEGGEVDVRAAYIALTIISVLNLPLDLAEDAPARQHGMTQITDKLGDWLSRCQTYEGGISAAPGNEAHGAYAFCVLAALSILGDPRETGPKYLDLPLLAQWLTSRQNAPEGGFSGRTNKLVDACYSHWVGGCWPLLEAMFSSIGTEDFRQAPETSLHSREGLIRYVLCCCQAEDGGLRDKPGKYPDAYHCCYSLAGLSAAQHYSSYIYPEDANGLVLPAPFGWGTLGDADVKWNGKPEADESRISDDIVDPIHPVFVIPFGAVEFAMEKFRGTSVNW